MSKTKFEALIEHIINDETEAAKELFHDIVVQKSRELYNEIVSENEESEEDEDNEEQVEEAGGDQSDDMINDVENIEADEEGMDDMSMNDAGNELGSEMGMDDEAEEDSGEEDLEDRVVDLETMIDELKAEFDQLMSQEAGEPEHSDMDMGGDDMDMGGDDDMMGMPKEGMVREYVEKVKHPSNTEGQTVGTGASDKPSVNSKSIVDNMKNDMGGTVKNLVQGGAESAPDGQAAYKKPNNMYAKGFKDSEYASRNVNQVGGNKGASDFYGTKAKAKTGEEGGTNDKSILKKI